MRVLRWVAGAIALLAFAGFSIGLLRSQFVSMSEAVFAAEASGAAADSAQARLATRLADLLEARESELLAAQNLAQRAREREEEVLYQLRASEGALTERVVLVGQALDETLSALAETQPTLATSLAEQVGEERSAQGELTSALREQISSQARLLDQGRQIEANLSNRLLLRDEAISELQATLAATEASRQAWERAARPDFFARLLAGLPWLAGGATASAILACAVLC